MHVGKYILLQAVFFLSMKNIKTAERNRLTDRHLANILRISNASFNANIENIVFLCIATYKHYNIYSVVIM